MRDEEVLLQEALIELGEHIRSARVTSNHSQTSLARQLGLSKQCVSSWENGRSPPMISNLLRMASLIPFDLPGALEGALTRYRHAREVGADTIRERREAQSKTREMRELSQQLDSKKEEIEKLLAQITALQNRS